MLVIDANVIVEITLERLGVQALTALGDEQLTLDCRLVTLDGPLWRRTRHLGFVVTPSELHPTANDPRTDPSA